MSSLVIVVGLALFGLVCCGLGIWLERAAQSSRRHERAQTSELRRAYADAIVAGDAQALIDAWWEQTGGAPEFQGRSVRAPILTGPIHDVAPGDLPPVDASDPRFGAGITSVEFDWPAAPAGKEQAS